ncbi:hypothetical protein OG21DRAFT_1526253 [Imleria badia]|nr:hypothetical protein OG21DRAFT_1526253 [Imleria badia]
MDPRIVEDTAPLHWMLDQKQMIKFLGNLFPDDRLFPSSNSTSSPTNGGVTSIVDHMKTIWQRSKDRWAYYPDSPCAEEKITQLFNSIIQHIPNSHLCTRGSISTHPLDIHQFPKEFLQILLRIMFVDGTILGFDSTVSLVDHNQKKIQIIKQGTAYAVFVDMLRGTTMWSGKVVIDKGEEEVIVKDLWVDLLRQYTEGIIDCLHAHHDTLKDTSILHHDISLLNLLFVLVYDDLNLNTDFLNRALQEPERTQLHTKIQSLPHHGLLADWGYAVPITRCASDAPVGVHLKGEENTLPRSELSDGHSIIIPVVDKPLPHSSGSSIDANPLQRMGTWAWMATELSYIGPRTPVEHQAHHDLKSFFYILLAICLLYDEPGKVKPPKVLTVCFNPFFSVMHPSTLKTVTVQSPFGWTALMLPYISQYFQSIIPLLQKIQDQLIMPIQLQGKTVSTNEQFTHDDFIDSIVVMLFRLWKPY